MWGGGQSRYSNLREVELGHGQSSPTAGELYKLNPNDIPWETHRDNTADRQKRQKTTLIVLGCVLGVIVVGLAVSTSADSKAADALPVVYGPTPPKPGAGITAGGSDAAAPAASPAAAPADGSGADARDYGLAGGAVATYGDGNFTLDPTYRPCMGDNLHCGMKHAEPVTEEDFRGLERHAHSKRGLVAADNSRCSEIGRDVMAEGGNAVDAAVATALCQGVVNPISSGIGGGAFIMVRMANGSAEFIDARETAPAAANATMFDGKDAYASLDGGLAIAVPTELLGLEAAWRRHGSGAVAWQRLVSPAADLARAGYAAHPYLLHTLAGPYNLARIRRTQALREAFLVPTAAVPDAGAADDGSAWRLPYPGELCCMRPKLADTLDAVAANGAAWLYAPERAEVLAAEIQAAGGIITAADLAATNVSIVPALAAALNTSAGAYTLHIPPPPSSAAVVAFALKFLAGYQDAGDMVNKPDLFTHRLVEAMKHGFAARVSLGDPGDAAAPGALAANISAVAAALLDDAFVDQMRALTKDDGVLPLDQYGGAFNPLAGGVGAPPDDHGTSHFCIVDGDMNAVSVTTTVNTVFGSGVVSASLGIVLNNEMDDFSQPNRTSSITPHPSPANFIGPGKRPLSAMSPTIVTDAQGRLRAVAGASGGPLIVSSTLQTLARLLLLSSGTEEAVMGARVHDQLLPTAAVMFEDFEWGEVDWRLANATRAYLARVGDALEPRGAGLGVSQAISVNPDTGLMHGMSDARKDGAAVGIPLS